MPQPRYSWAPPTLAAALLLGLVSFAAAGAPFASDPVQDLRQILLQPIHDVGSTSKELDLRRRLLQERIAALTRGAHLRDALLLEEWRNEDSDEPLATIDQAARTEVAHRFEQLLIAVLERGDATNRLAAAHMIGDVAGNLRGGGIRGWSLRGFGPTLADRTRDADLAVCEAAARALGLVNADPAVAVPAFTRLFEMEETQVRRAAATGLLQLMTQAGPTARRRGTTMPEASRAQVVNVGQAILPVVCGGLADPDKEVRRLSIAAIQEIAVALSASVAEMRSGMADNPADVETCRQGIDKERAELAPLLAELNAQSGGLTGALRDTEPEVRLQAHHALESISSVMVRLRNKSVNVQTLMPVAFRSANQAEAGGSTGIVLAGLNAKAGPLQVLPSLERLRGVVSALSASLNDPDAPTRRAAVDALETLGDEAAGAIPALVGALGDPDLFVRWAAARTLGKLGPRAASRSVPGLVRLLCDPDLDVRVVAADALNRLGPEAEAAVPALVNMLARGEVEMRLAAIRGLEGIGRGALPALGQLIVALADPDARVRQAAARLIGRFGPAALPAKEALRRALDDEDAEVRAAASDALLELLALPIEERPPSARLPLHPKATQAPIIQAAAWESAPVAPAAAPLPLPPAVAVQAAATASVPAAAPSVTLLPPTAWQCRNKVIAQTK
jgi:HEAT repeat protein